MSRSYRGAALRLPVAALVVLSFDPCRPVFAQASPNFQLEEIIVTAQRREQSLQDVSVAISAFTGDALQERVIEDVADLQFAVPNLIANARQVSIRGVGNNSGASTSEAGLGYHSNGVYINTPAFVSGEYFDLERIEVLRGPQGTLYGRNTTAGVLNILTKKPDDDLGGYIQAQVGNFSAQRLQGAINLPLSGNVKQRFAGFSNRRDGYTDNLFTGNDIDNRDTFGIRSSTAFEFSERFSADLVVEYLQEDSNRSRETKGTCTKDPTTGCSALSAGFETPDTSTSIYQLLNTLIFGGQLIPPGDYFANAINPADFRTVNVDQEPTFELEQLIASLEFNYSFGDYTFTSLTGYVDTDSDTFADFDRFATDVQLAVPVTFRADGRNLITTRDIVAGRRNLLKAEQFTQEFRLASNYDGGFDFLVGLFYFDDETASQTLITHSVQALAAQTLGLPAEFDAFDVLSDPVTTESLALFGEGYFRLTDDTTLTVGLRLTDDEKSIVTRQLFLNLTDPTPISAEQDWQELTGKITLEHFLSDDSLVFGTFSRGYKAGGVNAGATNEGAEFDPEYINVFEVGTKNTLLGGRLVANVGAFYYDYEDLQAAQVTETATLTTNTDAEVYGLEGEFFFAVNDALQIDLVLALLETELQDFTSADQGDPLGIAPNTVPALDENGNPRIVPGTISLPQLVKDLDGNELNNAPNTSVKFGISYTFDVTSEYDLTLRADHFWQDDYFANGFNKPSDRLESWSQTDAQILLEPRSGDWFVRAFVKNIDDNDDVLRRGQDGPLVGRFRSVNVLEPRTYGVEINYTFE
ncbi:MAG: TonB-dependent receptor [Pseudomonadota bacterium]